MLNGNAREKEEHLCSTKQVDLKVAFEPSLGYKIILNKPSPSLAALTARLPADWPTVLLDYCHFPARDSSPIPNILMLTIHMSSFSRKQGGKYLTIMPCERLTSGSKMA